MCLYTFAIAALRCCDREKIIFFLLSSFCLLTDSSCPFQERGGGLGEWCEEVGTECGVVMPDEEGC